MLYPLFNLLEFGSVSYDFCTLGYPPTLPPTTHTHTHLLRYREGKIALRWRVESEVLEGKGQFVCGELSCGERSGLASYEVNFACVFS